MAHMCSTPGAGVEIFSCYNRAQSSPMITRMLGESGLETISAPTGEPMESDAEIEELHRRCGVFTEDTTARSMLGSIGWTDTADLACACLLDPCVGEGAFLVPAAEALVGSLRRTGIPLTNETLDGRIIGFEIHRRSFHKARAKIRSALRRLGVDSGLARSLASTWVSNGDFLLRDFGESRFTHLVANPPYLRWANIPPALSTAYRAALPGECTSGDLSVAFIARMIELAADGARIALLSPDRWLYAVYAERFRSHWMKRVCIEHVERVDSWRVFRSSVSTYPVIARLTKASRCDRAGEGLHPSLTDGASLAAVVDGWWRRFPDVEEVGCEIRVGPALGCEAAFVGRKENLDVEKELLIPCLRPREIVGDQVVWGGNSVINVHSPGGDLISLDRFPRALRHFEAFKGRLQARACVKGKKGQRHSDRWYRTIDRLDPEVWSRNKILLPEIVRIPRIALDDDGYLPSHGIYAIFSDVWPLPVLRDLMASGVFGLVMECIAPRLNGNYKRCYKRFLSRVPLPFWNGLEHRVRSDLAAVCADRDRKRFSEIIARLYEVDTEFLLRFATSEWRASIDLE